MSDKFKGVQAVSQFQSYSIPNLVRQELGVKSFQEIGDVLTEIKRMIDEMINIADQNELIPRELSNLIINHIEKFNSHAVDIITYNMDGDTSFQQRSRIIESVKKWHKSLFSGTDDNRRLNNFLQIYNSLKIYSLFTLEKDKSEIETLKNDAIELKRKSEEILLLLQSKASGESVQDYAIIFKNQSEVHSNFCIRLRPFNIKIGNAELWLSLSVIMVVLFLLFILKINTIFPISIEKIPSVVTIELITRLLIISFSIYLITFSFKQYSIQKHLQTINRHRQNTLNSFKLFIESLDANDISTRNALMVEVARAIYDSGQSGYISTKDSSDSSPSIIEMTRYVNQK